MEFVFFLIVLYFGIKIAQVIKNRDPNWHKKYPAGRAAEEWIKKNDPGQ